MDGSYYLDQARMALQDLPVYAPTTAVVDTEQEMHLLSACPLVPGLLCLVRGTGECFVWIPREGWVRV